MASLAWLRHHPFLSPNQTTSIPHPLYPTLKPLQGNLNLPTIPRTRITTSISNVQRRISTSSHQQTRDQLDRSPRAHFAHLEQVDRHHAVAAGFCDRERTYVVVAAGVESDGLSCNGQGEYGGGAVLHATEAEVEDA